MFEIKEEEIQSGITKYKITKNGTFLSYKEWIVYLKESTEFIKFYIDTLRRSNYKGYFWEVKPINENGINEAFELSV